MYAVQLLCVDIPDVFMYVEQLVVAATPDEFKSPYQYMNLSLRRTPLPMLMPSHDDL